MGTPIYGNPKKKEKIWENMDGIIGSSMGEKWRELGVEKDGMYGIYGRIIWVLYGQFFLERKTLILWI